MVFKGNISDIVIVAFVKKNIFGAGQLALSLPDRHKVFIDSFRKKHRSDFIELFEILNEEAKFLNMSITKAIKYVNLEVKDEKSLNVLRK